MNQLSGDHKGRPTDTVARGCTGLRPLSDSVADVAYYGACAEKLLAGVRQRWSEQNKPFSMTQALCVLLSYIAGSKSHDPFRLQRVSGFPLGFVSMAIFQLSRNTYWLSSRGYADLVDGIEDGISIEEFDTRIGDLMNAILSGQEYAKLKTEWTRSMGVKIEI